MGTELKKLAVRPRLSIGLGTGPSGATAVSCLLRRPAAFTVRTYGLWRHRRPLLRRMAKARKPALAHHVNRAQRMGKWVL